MTTYDLPGLVGPDGDLVIEPVSPEAQKALEDWLWSHIDELHELLAPFDLNAYLVEMPEFKRAYKKEN